MRGSSVERYCGSVHGFQLPPDATEPSPPRVAGACWLGAGLPTDGEGAGLGAGEGVGAGEGEGDGAGAGVGLGVGVGVGFGAGAGVGEGLGLGAGALGFPPQPHGLPLGLVAWAGTVMATAAKRAMSVRMAVPRLWCLHHAGMACS